VGCAAGGGCAANNVKGSTGPFTVSVTGTDIQAVACAGTTPFANSGTQDSQAYTLKLDAIKFAPATGTPIPTGSSLMVNVTETVAAGQKTYDFICSSTDGTTVPNCTCDTTATPALTKTLAAAFPLVVAVSTDTTIQAVGCLSNTNYVQSDTPPASASYSAATKMATPTINPANGTINNPTPIQFTNNEGATLENAYFCYTTNNTAPATASAGVCYAPASTHGATTCTTTATAPQAMSSATDATAPTVSTTGTTVRAIACDAGAVGKKASNEATAVVYTLVAGDPSISPNGGQVNLGSVITLSSATQSAVFHWTNDGTAPTCSTALGAHSGVITAGSTPVNGMYQGTYYAMGQEAAGKPLRVIACQVGYTQSAVPASATFTYAVAAPTISTGTTGDFDDYLNPDFTLTPGISTSWLCVGNGAGCGSTAGTCSGTGVLPVSHTCNYTPDVSGQPNVAPSCDFGGPTQVPTLLGLFASGSVVACTSSQPATAAIKTSAPTAWSYTFHVSQVELKTPNPATGNTASTPVVFDLKQTTQAPDGDATTTPATLGATHGGTYICASSSAQAVVAQPSNCAQFASLSPGNGWTCALITNATDTLSLPDVGENTTYQAFACKDFMTYSTASSVAVTFAPYLHPTAFPLTGDPTQDFTASETISSSTGAAYVTWDQTNLYFGFDKASAFANGDVVHFYVGSPNGTGTTAVDSVAAGAAGGVALPTGFNALYHVYWNFQSGAHGIDAYGGTPAAWAASGNAPTVKYNMSATWVELEIPLSDLANASTPSTGYVFNLLGGLYNGGADQVAAWPFFTGTSTKWGAVTGNTTTVWNEFQIESLNDAYVPNDTNNIKP
jgi:hypothetical protein